MLSAILAKDKLKKLSWSNRIADYNNVFKLHNPSLWNVHKEINAILLRQSNNYKHYDYGEGYFYQSFDDLYITGYRNTTERLKKLDLFEITKNKNVLDIGCNAGFVLLSLSKVIKSGYGFDINPYLIEIANSVKKHLNISNCDFLDSTFEDLQRNEKYDVVLSLANHSTFDKNTRHNLDEYFIKCSNFLKKSGLLVFESHPPELEDKNKIKENIKIISQHFKILDIFKHEFTGFLDKNRTYILAEKV
jgi:SAM-dependent methyltransferase